MILFGQEIIVTRGKKKFCLLLLLSVLAAFIIYAVFNKIKRRVQQQIVWICVLPMLFVGVSVIFNHAAIPFENPVLNNMYGLFFCTLYFILLYIVRSASGIKWGDLKQALVKHRMMFLLLLGIVLIRLPYLTVLPRWDAGEYYFRFSNGAAEFMYSGFMEFNSLFALCGHPTLAMSLVYLPGELIFPKQFIGVSLTSLLLTGLAVWCLYKILMKLLHGISPVKAAVFTLVISMAPLFYSTTAYFNPDYVMTLFLIFLIYSYVYHKPVLAGFASLLCFQTKETGLVIVGGLVIGVFIQHILENKGIEIAKKIFTDARLYFTLAATLIQLQYNRSIGGLSNWRQNGLEEPGLGIRWDNNGQNCLGFNPDYILTRLKQQFILNFNWILLLVIILCIILLLVNHRKVREISQKTHDVCPVAAAFAALLTFSCLYITSTVARYNVPGDIMLYLLMFYVLYKTEQCLFKGKAKQQRISVVFSGVFFILIAVQSFFTVDPLTILSFRVLDAGNKKMVFTGKVDRIEDMYYGDYLVYNTQYTYLDRAYDKLLKEVGYEPGKMDIILPDHYGVFICGNIPLYYLNWDSKLQKRVFYENENTSVMPSYYETREYNLHTINLKELKDQAVLVFNPYYLHIDIDEELEKISPYYQIGAQKRVETMQGSILYYELKRITIPAES